MQIKFNRKFIKQFKKTPEKIKQTFYFKSQLFKENKNNPILNHHSLSGKLKGYWSINVTGDWRAIYFIEDDSYVF